MATLKLSRLFLLATMAAISSSSSPRQQSTKFVPPNCNAILNSDLCVSFLAKYACKVQENPLQIAQIAAKVSFTNVKSAASKASSLYYEKALNSTKTAMKTLKALKDCTELLKGTVDNTKNSLSELKKMKGTAGDAWGLSNVQTCMIAVLTKEDTCTYRLEEMGPVVKLVRGRVGCVEACQ